MFRCPTLTSKQFAFLLLSVACVLSTRRDTSCEGRDGAGLAIPVLQHCPSQRARNTACPGGKKKWFRLLGNAIRISSNLAHSYFKIFSFSRKPSPPSPLQAPIADTRSYHHLMLLVDWECWEGRVHDCLGHAVSLSTIQSQWGTQQVPNLLAG